VLNEVFNSVISTFSGMSNKFTVKYVEEVEVGTFKVSSLVSFENKERLRSLLGETLFFNI